jgi:predicted lactoylglutathione lyase
VLDHVGIYVDNLEKSHKFYKPLLQSIGYEVIFSTPNCVAYGYDKNPFFEIYSGKDKTHNVHIAFQAKSKQGVEAFYEKAILLGAKDNGAPGYREYTPGYYAAFVIDSEGQALEAAFLDHEYKKVNQTT